LHSIENDIAQNKRGAFALNNIRLVVMGPLTDAILLFGDTSGILVQNGGQTGEAKAAL
jgi:hypothetical protein